MAFAPAHLIRADSIATAGSYTTGSISPTKSRLLVKFAMRSTDLADVSGETLQCVAGTLTVGAVTKLNGTGLTSGHVFYDTSTRMAMALFLLTGVSGSGTLVLSCVSGRSMSRGGWSVEEWDGVDDSLVVQTVGATNTGTALSATLAAFGNAANRPMLFACDNTNGSSGFTPEAGWTSIDAASATFTQMTAWNSTTADTTATATSTGSTTWAEIAVEIKPASTVKPFPLALLQQRVM